MARGWWAGARLRRVCPTLRPPFSFLLFPFSFLFLTHLPEVHQSVASGAGEQLTGRRKSDGAHREIVPLKVSALDARSGVPKPYRGVRARLPATRRQQVAV